MSPSGSNSFSIALLGRRDQPTDALRDYCHWLAGAMNRRGVRMEIAEVSWESKGFLAALFQLWSKRKSWQGRWVLLQYTALGWSRRGFPLGFLCVLHVLRRKGARCAVVFHDALPYGGSRRIDQIRRACQLWVMRRAYQWAERSILTIPLDHVGWLPPQPTKAAFIPIGANLPPVPMNKVGAQVAATTRTVAVFVITGEPATLSEVRDIGCALKRAKRTLGELRLVVVGRGSSEAEPALRRELDGSGVEALVLGLLPPDEIAKTLALADVLLFVRGGVSSRRGSALAGIACGLPIVGYAGPETGFPVTEAGLELVPMGDREALAKALDHVLSDDRLRQDLRRKSMRAHRDYFSWEKIAEQFATELSGG
jgi:glycosyltransferase involved in cell wall biosynthesis